MQAYKLKGKVDRDGKLIITEPTNLTPGDVEVIVLKLTNSQNDLNNEYELLAEDGLKEVYDQEPEGLWEQCLES